MLAEGAVRSAGESWLGACSANARDWFLHLAAHAFGIFLGYFRTVPFSVRNAAL